MAIGEFSPLELAQEAFPVVSDVALKLAVETRNRGLGKLGGLLLMVVLKDVTTLSHRQADAYEDKIEVVLLQVERACMWPKNAGTSGYPTLQRIAQRKSVNIHQGLKEFSKRIHEFESLIASLDQIQTIKDLTPEDMGLDSSPDSKKDNVPGYPPHVNEALYCTLDLHTCCECPEQHLKLAKVRLDSIEEHSGAKIPFEVLFPASPVHDRGSNPGQEIWHETMMMVSSKRPVIKKTRASQKSRNRLSVVQVEGKELPLGDFCRHLKAKLGFCVRFNLMFESADPVLRTDETFTQSLRKVKFAQSMSLANVLHSHGQKITTKERFHLAYILAKSVWQYYGSDWMKNPWTHDDIQFVEEQGAKKNAQGTMLSSYNPYFNPNFETPDIYIGEYCPEGILIHRYPGVLALAIMLLEIIQGQPFDYEGEQPYSLPQLKNYYKFAWNLVTGTTLDCNIMYKEVVKKCLDGKLFKDAPFDPDDPQNGLEIRRSILYREIVFPLKHLLTLSSSSFGFEEPVLQTALVMEVSETITEQYSGRPSYESDRGRKMSPRPTSRLSFQSSMSDPQIHPNIALYSRDESLPARPQFTPSESSYSLLSSRNSTLSSRPTSRDEFEIAIICALKAELDAVTLLVDEFFDVDGDAYGRAAEDQNTYMTGRIGRYNVVLALMPGMGKANAAKVAANFRSSYRGIELALLVGICGGVPRDNDNQEIILGDVIISGSIVQYDFGRRFANKFTRKSTFSENIGRANSDVRSFVATLSTCHVSELLEARTSQHLISLQMGALRRYPGKYDYPGVMEDRLFEPTYRHKHHASFNCSDCDRCEKSSDPVCERAMLGAVCSELLCDESRIVQRKRLENKMHCSGSTAEIQQPMVHIGPVASGDTVMRSGEDRDELVKQEKIIAFEMEGAGVWDNLSCIIIKGVCDYSDCHKNKKWQNFAAATAASAMKAILERYNRRDRSPRASWG
ncbi:hypothetical protein ABW20_dc0109503 [Dactylellina cionopaga]|nr:hypothetical protein ABW20_dc0109503 [Dactylellina cionopaga]